MSNLAIFEKPYSSQIYNLAYNLIASTVSKNNFFFSGDVIYTDDNLFPSINNQDKNYVPFYMTDFSYLQPTIADINSF